jgi:aspartyl-tRNA(Asn)/glutamyl-tRNA(Gln) amidotransferase subunit B
MNKDYTTTIGLEIHLQIATRTKAFCGCVNEFGQAPNTAVCPVCLGFPGTLPVLNKEYLNLAIKVAVALNCQVSGMMKFDRKNYFYPDIPKNYQISQYDMPLSKNGFLNIMTTAGQKKIGITRVHMEEDAGKLIHDEKEPFSYADFNRAGTPLIEIVSDPDISSPEEAYLYLKALKSILEYLEVSDCDMEKGSLRCDANISLKPEGQKELGVKVELKNMNSLKAIRQALEYEQIRQAKRISAGETIIQQTRLWNEKKKVTESMRAKEQAHDYRYFPDPDLIPFTIDSSVTDRIKASLPELPAVRQKRFQLEYNISEYDSLVLVSDKNMADFFESCVQLYNNPKAIANWLIGDIKGYMNEHNIDFRLLKTTPRHLTEIIELIDKNIISNKMAKQILAEVLSTGRNANDIIKENQLFQITDESEIQKLAQEVINENPKVVDDYISGKSNALGFLVGQLMKKTKGHANPATANKLLKGLMAKKSNSS